MEPTKSLVTKPGLFVKKSKETFDSEYKLGKYCGNGSFGTVYTCTNKALNEMRAVKIIYKSVLDEEMTL
jgi:serine/threonine protein kinase